MKDNKLEIKKNVRLRESDVEKIEQFMEQDGRDNMSSAIRFLTCKALELREAGRW